MIIIMSSFAAMAALFVGAYPFTAHFVTRRLIVPGKSVGKMTLGRNGRATLSRFGKPDAYDVGMSQTRQAWLGNGKDRSTLFVHTVAASVSASHEAAETCDASASPSLRRAQRRWFRPERSRA